jgi:serine/threonine protein phosphatase PrpC
VSEPARFWVGLDGGEVETLAPGSGSAAVFTRAYEPGRNQDAMMVAELGDGRALLAVADGAGGLPSGDRAAELAVRGVARSVRNALDDGQSVRAGVLEGFDRANAAIQELASGAASTLVVVELDGGTIRTYHAGDSAALVTGQRGKLKLVTIMHSPVGYAVEAGYLSESEAMHHDERHLVSNMLGTADMRIEIGPALELATRDTVVLGSDGLFDNLELDEIARAVRAGGLARAAGELAACVDRRMHAPRESQPSKPDDVAFLLYRAARSA